MTIDTVLKAMQDHTTILVRPATDFEWSCLCGAGRNIHGDEAFDLGTIGCEALLQEEQEKHVAEMIVEALDLTMEPGRWWRSLSADGTIWCESSDEQEVREMSPGFPIQRLFIGHRREWREA